LDGAVERLHLARQGRDGPNGQRTAGHYFLAVKRWQLRWLVFAALAPGCYHYAFEQAPVPAQQPVETFVERRATYFNGFFGTGRVDTARYCARPVRTELRVTPTDVALSVVTLLIYTPHTLSVTCPLGERPGPDRDRARKW
jgi:hypothetical protein